MIPNRRMIALSVALHLLGVFGLWAVGQLSAPVLSLQTPQAIDVRFPAPPAPPSREDVSSDPPVSRETPKPEPSKPKATPEKTKATPKSTPKPKTTPKATPRETPKAKATPKATPKPKETTKPKETPRPKATEPAKAPERTSPPAPPQPTRTYYPKPPREAASGSSSPPRPASTQARPRETPHSSTAPALSASGAKQGALIGVRGGPSLNAYYSRQAIALIAANFKVPPERQSEATCLIGFDILADGRIVNPRIVKSSGDPNLDILAIDALRRTERLPPLPDEFRGRSVEAQLTFSFTTSTSGN